VLSTKPFSNVDEANFTRENGVYESTTGVEDVSKVFVVDKNKQPLAPTHPARARVLLNEGKAAVYRRFPFTLSELPGISISEPSKDESRESVIGIVLRSIAMMDIVTSKECAIPPRP
jgi:RRXRR protein